MTLQEEKVSDLRLYVAIEFLERPVTNDRNLNTT